MALADAYVQIYGQLPEVFKRICDGQAPEKFTRQHLKDLGFGSSNYHAVIPLLKALRFLAADGSPTARYHEYRDHSQSRFVLGQALKEAYSDLFTIKVNPTESDRALIEGKFKSAHNSSENVLKLKASTFFALLSIADIKAIAPKPSAAPAPSPDSKNQAVEPAVSKEPPHLHARPTLHYNIQIHLPATKDVEVFNAIFKSLKEHLLD